MSAATLQEGIQRAILEAVPEITEVVDTTDHEQGENPTNLESARLPGENDQSRARTLAAMPSPSSPNRA